jgi:hypothetical protein
LTTERGINLSKGIDMRTVFVIILRLFVGNDFPDRLRGTLQPVGDRQEKLTFQDDSGLLESLHQVICTQLANSPCDVSTTKLTPDPQDKEPQA